MLLYRNLEMLSSQDSIFPFNFCLWNTIKFKIFTCVFTFYCNDTRMIFILFCWSCYWILSIWSIFIDLSWYFGIFRLETTLVKKLLGASAILSFLSKIESCLTNVIFLWVELFAETRDLIDFQNVLLSGTFSWSRLL